jgi:hypothetical protein
MGLFDEKTLNNAIETRGQQYIHFLLVFFEVKGSDYFEIQYCRFVLVGKWNYSLRKN